MKRLHPTELCLKGENLTSLYKSAAMNIHSFRELKYTIGLSCLHGKKTDFLLQEVFARLILYNYASLIARKIPVPQEKQINFSVAILVCKQFLKGKSGLLKYLEYCLSTCRQLGRGDNISVIKTLFPL